MRILGVDPGLMVTGYGVIEAGSSSAAGESGFSFAKTSEKSRRSVSEGGQFKLLEAGVIKSSADQGLPRRLSCLYQALQEIINEYKPANLVLEELYSHYKHQMTAIAMAHARGVIALCADKEKQISLISYPAKRVRLALTGNGNASKAQVQRTVQNIFSLAVPPSPADVSDALALAVAHAYIASANSRGIESGRK